MGKILLPPQGIFFTLLSSTQCELAAQIPSALVVIPSASFLSRPCSSIQHGDALVNATRFRPGQEAD
eukprot:scaffold46870_cov33-Tisochrysis_lutea.AAC.2